MHCFKMKRNTISEKYCHPSFITFKSASAMDMSYIVGMSIDTVGFNHL